MAPTSSANPDLAALIASWLRQNDVVSNYVGKQIGPLREHHETPRHIEIGLTRSEPNAEVSPSEVLVSVHVWSRSGTREEVQEVLRAAEVAITAGGSASTPKREFGEVRFDEEHGAYRGLLRMKLVAE